MDDFNWLAYKAQVSASILPIVLKQEWQASTGVQYRNAVDLAIDRAVSIAERLEQRLKGG